MGGGGVPLRGRAIAVLTVVAMTVALLSANEGLPAARALSSDRPNIVLVLTDDQRFDSLKVMPEVQQLAQQGMTLRRAIVSDPLCCPSRSTILTGRYAHTTGVYSNSGVNGGWPSFQAWESSTIAVALDDVGYRTALIGKYLNLYVGDDLYVPPGWDRWSAFDEPDGAYFDYRMFDDAAGVVDYGSRPRDYSTDVIRRLSANFVNTTPSDTPLFLLAATFAPHGPSVAAPRHAGTFASTPVSLGPAVNEANMADKPSYLSERPQVDPKLIRARTRKQWETLLAVDQLVGRLVDVLTDAQRIDDTIFIFTSDNGFLNQEHRWRGKDVPYEESIRVPMVIAYPREIPPASVTNALASNVDLAPTIADFAGVAFPADGVSLRPLLSDRASSARDAIVLEHAVRTAPAYCGVRTPGFMFARYATGEEELYDLAADPHQIDNVAASRPNKTMELRSLTQTLCAPVPPGFSWEPVRPGAA